MAVASGSGLSEQYALLSETAAESLLEIVEDRLASLECAHARPGGSDVAPRGLGSDRMRRSAGSHHRLARALISVGSSVWKHALVKLFQGGTNGQVARVALCRSAWTKTTWSSSKRGRRRWRCRRGLWCAASSATACDSQIEVQLSQEHSGGNRVREKRNGAPPRRLESSECQRA